MTHKQTLDRLNYLLGVNADAEKGFRSAAGIIRNSELETAFLGYADQHAKFLSELQEEADRLEGERSDPGTFGGTLHRGWMDLKSALTGHSAASILASCESGEESAQIAYDDAVDVLSSGKIHTLLEKQRQQVKEMRTRLARLVGEMKDGRDFQRNE